MRIVIALLLFAGFAVAQGRRGGGDVWSRISSWDTDGDGKVSKEEFTGPDRFFERLDTDGDGFVTEEEAKAMRRGGGRRSGQGDQAKRMATQFDKDKDGKVSEAEWQAFFKKADENEDGVLDSGELTAALGGRAYNDTAPKGGTDAPAAKAKDAKSGAIVDLKQLRRPTVLVFGSWT